MIDPADDALARAHHQVRLLEQKVRELTQERDDAREGIKKLCLAQAFVETAQTGELKRVLALAIAELKRLIPGAYPELRAEAERLLGPQR